MDGYLLRTRALALPTADSFRRGQFILLENPSVADDGLYIGIQEAAGTYAYKLIPFGAHPTLTLIVQEGDVNVDTAVTSLDFDSSDFNTTSSPAGEANIALNYGTGAGQPAEGNHNHTIAIGVFHDTQTDTSPTTSSTTDTGGTYYVGGSGTISLPTGTWSGSMVTHQRLAHSADGQCGSRAVLGGTTGTVITGSMSSVGSILTPVVDATGLSGSVSWSCESRPTVAGTMTNGACTMIFIGTRTA